MSHPVWALGLMSGTSLDGVDVALVKTDGMKVEEIGDCHTIPYDDEFRDRLRDGMHGKGDWLKLERDLTIKHAEAVKKLLAKSDITRREVRVIGFHGQTMIHRPNDHITWQMGDGSLLAELTGIDVVCDFRRHDMAAGGQGAPLVPLFHAAIAHGENLPVVILNIGGIANVSWVGVSEKGADVLAHDILAFDTGPGNVLLNDWARRTIGKDKDEDGHMALAGKAHEDIVNEWLKDPFFKIQPPKSLDRNYFSLLAVEKLSKEDAATTLTAFTARAIRLGSEYFPLPAKKWFVSGGGRHNPALMKALAKELGEVYPVETLGWQGDAIEAQAFAFLAVRSLQGLPLTLPTTTGVSRAVTGGAFYRA